MKLSKSKNCLSVLMMGFALLGAGCSPSSFEDAESGPAQPAQSSSVGLSEHGSSPADTVAAESLPLKSSEIQVSGAPSSSDLTVRWTSAFSTVDMLEQPEKVELKTQADLESLIHAKWNSEFDVVNSKTGDAVIASCADYFDNSTDRTETKRPFEMQVFRSRILLCQSARLLQKAKPSLVSYFPDPLLSVETPYQWPKDFAFVISKEQADRLAASAELKTWAQADPNPEVELAGPWTIQVRHPGDVQEVEVLGFGDFNSDGIEDAVVMIHEYVTEATYSSLRLLVLTRDSEEVWLVLESH